MPICEKCGFNNKEGNKYCVNCGSILELTETEIRAQKAKEKIAAKNWLAYFLIFMGFSSMFGGFFTYITSLGTIIQSMTLSVAMPYILVGFVLLVIGLGIYSFKIEE